METAVDLEKKLLRKEFLSKLLSLTKEEIKRRSSNVERILLDSSLYKEAHRIMAYCPLKGEVDIFTMVRKDTKKKFCFPVMDISQKELTPYEVPSLSDEYFIPGPYAVLQPDTQKSAKVDLEEIDMVIVPGLAFDTQKNRLGRGGGFYDLFLQRLHASARTVGVAFDFQILQTLPIHPELDRRLDFVISESRMF